MNIQEGVAVNVSTATPTPCSSAPPPTSVQRIMPVLYVNQPNVKTVTPATSSSSPGVPASSSAPTILTAMPQIQLASGGNHTQIIHPNPNPNAYSYVPVRQVYQQAKTVKEPQKKVFVTSLNQTHNNKSNQVNLILPNAQSANNATQPKLFPAQTSLILPQIGTMSTKGTITGMLVPSNTAAQNTNKQTVASLLLPANTKYPNIAPNKKVPIPNIIIPQQNITSKTGGVPNIIRQTNTQTAKNVVGILSPSTNTTNQQMTSLLLTPSNNATNKQPPTSVGLILPTSGGSHGIIVPQSTSGQSHSIIMPQTSGAQSHGIIVPQSTVGQSQVANLIFTSATTNTPVANLILSQPSCPTSSGTSLLIPQNPGGYSSPSTSLPPSNSPSAKTSIFVPVSVGPNKTNMLQPVTYTNGKKSIDSKSLHNKQSVLMKAGSGPEGTYSNLPPLQPISKEGINKSTPPHKSANGFPMNVPESLIMTPISDSEAIKSKIPEKISDEMTIERTMPASMEEKGTSGGLNIRMDEMSITMDEDYGRSDMTTMTTMTPLGTSDHEEGVVLDGEVTVRRLAMNKEDVPEKRQIEDEVKIELVKPERQKPVQLPPPRYQKPEDLNPMDVLEWDCQGVGKLPGSNIKFLNQQNFEESLARKFIFKEQYLDFSPMINPISTSSHIEIPSLPQFRINEYGLDLVVDNNKDDTSSKSNTPNSSQRNSDDKPPENNRTPKEGDKDQIYCCEGCGCYGLYTEFLLDTRFCSVGCKKIVLARNDLKRKKLEDKLKELRMRRKRRKIKIMAQRARKDGKEQKISEEEKKLTEAQSEQETGQPMSSDLMAKTWTNRLAELRKNRKSTEGSIKINPQNSDLEDSRAVSLESDSETSEVISRSPALTNPSDDDASSDRTAPSDLSNVTTWVNSSGEFMWSTYLQKCCNKAKPAPVKLFKDPFPYGKNGFKVGMKLEGIDPEHQAIISVLTVAQVKGHRIRLHFDGYPDHHDFWVNSDSPDIFPPGWCERNNHTLQPPRGYSVDNFNWNTYLKQCRSQPAPKSLFPKSNTPLCPSQFRVGMKLEAVDRKNSSLICVASVADLIDNRLLIHFDSWGDVYDYWTDPSSPYIHPVGWCEENGYDLTPPNNFKNPSTFSWDAYLKETKSQAAPARAFKPRSPNLFKREMKIEAIDKRAPSNLRPATVKEVMEYQIKITFDGYPEEFGYLVDDDCPDIHPTGWGHKTGHPVTAPPIPSQYTKNECGTKGCTGDGNVKGGFLVRHVTATTCPYSPQNLNKDIIPDRFCVNPDFYEVPEPINKSRSASSLKQDTGEDSTSSESRVKTRNSLLKDDIKEEPTIKIESEEKTEERIERRGRKRKLPDAEQRVELLDRLRKELITSVIDPGYKPNPAEQEMWVKHVATLGQKVNVTGGDPRMWNHKQVAAFVNTVIPSRAKLFLEQEIDGESFLMLTQNDLTKVLGLKLGPALKIYNCIILLRQKVMSL